MHICIVFKVFLNYKNLLCFTSNSFRNIRKSRIKEIKYGQYNTFQWELHQKNQQHQLAVIHLMPKREYLLEYLYKYAVILFNFEYYFKLNPN